MVAAKALARRSETKKVIFVPLIHHYTKDGALTANTTKSLWQLCHRKHGGDASSCLGRAHQFTCSDTLRPPSGSRAS
jgi:hypothetical protein